MINNEVNDSKRRSNSLNDLIRQRESYAEKVAVLDKKIQVARDKIAADVGNRLMNAFGSDFPTKVSDQERFILNLKKLYDADIEWERETARNRAMREQLSAVNAEQNSVSDSQDLDIGSNGDAVTDAVSEAE